MTLVYQVEAYQPLTVAPSPFLGAPRDAPRNQFMPQFQGLDPTATTCFTDSAGNTTVQLPLVPYVRRKN